MTSARLEVARGQTEPILGCVQLVVIFVLVLSTLSCLFANIHSEDKLFMNWTNSGLTHPELRLCTQGLKLLVTRRSEAAHRSAAGRTLICIVLNVEHTCTNKTIN